MNLRECQKFQFAAIALFISGILFFTSCGTSKVKLISRGEEFLKQKKFQEAIMEFRALADIDKNSAEAHWGLARAYEGNGQVFDTIEELRQVVLLAPENLEAKSKLGNYFLLLDPPQFWEVDKLLAEIFAADPNFVEGHILEASKMSLQGKPEAEVLKVLQHAISLDQSRVESYLSLARFYQKMERLQDAEKTIQKAIAVGPSSALGYMEYGRYLTFSNRIGEAEAEFKKAISAEPASLEAYESIASFYLSQRQLEKAEGAYKKLTEVQQNSPESRMALADFYALINRDPEAIEVFQGILAEVPSYVRARYRLGEIYLDKKELAKVNEEVEKLLSINDRDYQALLLRSRLKLQENDAEAAVKDLEEILKKNPSLKFGLFYMAQARLALGQSDQARAFINDLEKYHPNFLRSKLLHIQASFTAGDPEQALQQANGLIAAIKGTFPNADTSAQELEELRVRAISARGIANLELGNLAEAKNDLYEVHKLSPNSSAACVNLGRVLAAGGDWQGAGSLYEKALAIDPKNFDATAGVVSAMKKQKRFAEAYSKLDQMIAAEQDKKMVPAYRYLKAEAYSAEKNFSEAEAELQKAIQEDGTYLPAYTAYAELMIRKGETDRAIEQYSRLLEKKPDSATYTLMGMLEDARNNTAASEKAYRKALEINPQNAIAANNLAWNITESEGGNLDEAVQLVQTIMDRNQRDAGLHDTLGWAYFKKGLYAPAIENLKKAVAIDQASAEKRGGEANPAFRLRLGTVLASSGDKPSARKEVEIALRGEKGLSPKELQDAKSLLNSL